jgi:hypothetical protein
MAPNLITNEIDDTDKNSDDYCEYDEMKDYEELNVIEVYELILKNELNSNHVEQFWNYCKQKSEKRNKAEKLANEIIDVLNQDCVKNKNICDKNIKYYEITVECVYNLLSTNKFDEAHKNKFYDYCEHQSSWKVANEVINLLITILSK